MAYATDGKPESSPAQTVRRHLEEARAYRREIDAQIEAEYPFSLKLDHYVRDDKRTKDARRVKPKGRQLYRKLMHQVAQITKERHLEARATDPLTAQAHAGAIDIATYVVQSVIDDPIKDYDTIREAVVLGALAHRIGIGKVSFHPEIGPWGDLRFDTLRWDQLYWTPGFRSPHDPACPWVIELRRMRKEAVTAMKAWGWKHTEKVQSDAGYAAALDGHDTSLVPGQSRLGTSGDAPSFLPLSSEDHVTVALCWYRNVQKTNQQRVKDSKATVLPKDQRYMICPECGYHEYPPEGGGGLPPMGAVCPECAQRDITTAPPMERVDRELPTDEVLMYPNGELLIVPVHGQAGDEFYDDAWPWKLRSVPYFVLTGYVDSIEPIGMSETALDKSKQVMVNVMDRLAYEDLTINRAFTITPFDGLKNSTGEPWEMTDRPGQRAYWDSMQKPGDMVMRVPGVGLPPGWAEFYAQQDQSLRADSGTEPQLNPQQIAQANVGSVQQATESGEVIAEWMKKRTWRAESIFLGVILDYIRATWPDQRIQRLRGSSGVDEFHNLRAADIPNAEFTLSAAPASASIDAADVQATSQILQAPPPMRKFLARRYGISPTELAQYEADEQQAMQQQMQQQQAMQAQSAQAQTAPMGAPGMNGQGMQ